MGDFTDGWDDGRGRVFFTPREPFFLWKPKKSRSDVLKFPNFMKNPPQPTKKKVIYNIMVWPRNFDEFWVEIFGEGDSRKCCGNLTRNMLEKKPLEERLSFVLSENVFMRV